MPGPITFIDDGAVTTPQGFSAGATYAGLKTYSEDKLDLGLIVSDLPCVAAGVFTTSAIKSSTVTVNRENLAQSLSRAIIVNAGIANTSVGRQGYIDAQEMTSLAARKIGAQPNEVLVCSTGVIGVELPMSLIRTGVDVIQLSPGGGHDVARAMMTTDTRPKEVAVSFGIEGAPGPFGWRGQGVGDDSPQHGHHAFFHHHRRRRGSQLPSGHPARSGRLVPEHAVGGRPTPAPTTRCWSWPTAWPGNTPPYPPDLPKPIPSGMPSWRRAFYLTRELARDGEGASHLITVEVSGAATLDDARKAARTISASNLVKSAVYGADPNWGRILMAVGRSGAAADESKIDLFVNGVCIMEAGRSGALPPGRGGGPDAATRSVDSGKPQPWPGEATAWGCDLTQEYVIINSAYTT